MHSGLIRYALYCCPNRFAQQGESQLDNIYGSTGFLIHPATRKVLLHHRDRSALVYPDLWSFFGGSSEKQDSGDPVTTWLRELREELGIVLKVEQVIPFGEGEFANGKRRYVFYCEWPTLSEDFILGEGQGFAWFDLDDALQLPTLTPIVRADLLMLRERLASLGNTQGMSSG